MCFSFVRFSLHSKQRCRVGNSDGQRWRLTVNVLLLRHVLQGLVGLFCLINITDIQRKHSPRRCAKQRMKGKQVHSHLLLASSATGWPSAGDTDMVVCFF